MVCSVLNLLSVLVGKKTLMQTFVLKDNDFQTRLLLLSRTAVSVLCFLLFFIVIEKRSPGNLCFVLCSGSLFLD